MEKYTIGGSNLRKVVCVSMNISIMKGIWAKPWVLWEDEPPWLNDEMAYGQEVILDNNKSIIKGDFSSHSKVL